MTLNKILGDQAVPRVSKKASAALNPKNPLVKLAHMQQRLKTVERDMARLAQEKEDLREKMKAYSCRNMQGALGASPGRDLGLIIKISAVG